MKKSIITLVGILALALSSPGWARSPHDGPVVERLTEALNLDQQQVDAVTQILQEQREKRDTLHETLRTQKRADTQALRQETIERLRPILSAEQLQKFIQLGEARRARHEGRGAKHFAPAPHQ